MTQDRTTDPVERESITNFEEMYMVKKKTNFKKTP